ncbi:MAG: PEP-CTERM sorting domain-containing protein [Planctomycetota bacterium]|nr:PEP-CTERM sorting domain-containing protein [Planctomycetota bacterium]
MQRTHRIHILSGILVALVAPLGVSGAVISQSIDLTGPAIVGQTLNGLSARATFKLDTVAPNTLVITLKNTSTGVPAGTDSASQMLAGLSFDLGQPGALAGDPSITGGSAVIGPGGVSVGISPALSAGADISAWWGYGNNGTGVILPNRTTAMRGGNSIGFTGSNLQGPGGGIVTNPPLVAMGGQSGFADSVVVTLTLDKPLANLSFLGNGVLAEFGSDYRFAQGTFTVPEPASLTVLVLGSLGALLRRRRRA